MFLIGNLVDFEHQLRRAIAKRDVLGQFPAEYLGEVRLEGIHYGFAIVRVPRVGRLAQHIFVQWLWVISSRSF